MWSSIRLGVSRVLEGSLFRLLRRKRVHLNSYLVVVLVVPEQCRWWESWCWSGWFRCQWSCRSGPHRAISPRRGPSSGGAAFRGGGAAGARVGTVLHTAFVGGGAGLHLWGGLGCLPAAVSEAARAAARPVSSWRMQAQAGGNGFGGGL